MSNTLWIGNLSPAAPDTELKNIIEKRGCVENVTCFPSRSHAFVYLKSAEDAKKAKENLQGVFLHGNRLKIDFAKPAKPCKCLWITGISTSISKEDLEEEFSKFGKIEEFRFLQDKNAAIVDYSKQEDAIKALKAMRAKKIGGTMIRVDYSRFNYQSYIPSSEGPKWNEELPSNILCISYPPPIHIDEQMLHNALILFGEIESIKSFPSRYCSFVEFRSMEEALRAKNGLHGKLFNDPRISITFSRNEHAPSQYFTGTRGPRPVSLLNDSSFQPTTIGDPHWRSSPLNQMLSSPSASMNPLTKSTPGTWNVFDASQIQREPKRLRIDGHMLGKEMNSRILPNDQVFRGVPHVNSGAPSNTRFTNGSPNTHHNDVGYMWRGILAKGGTPVCRARCVPIGDWIGYEMPEIVNCSARTGLDMLAKHYADAIGFDIVFFLPDSEEDFASYTEFLAYMGDRNRAGVVKFGDGTTLFLVPPSDFLKTVLKVSGPARLYGVVLKFPPHESDELPIPTISQQHVNHVPPVTTVSTAPTGPSLTPELVSQQHLNYVPPVTAVSTAPAGLSITPELVATLASLTKVNSNSQPPPSNTVPGSLLNGRQFQGQIYEHGTSNLTSEFMQSNKVNDPNLAVTNNRYIQHPSFNLPRHEEVASVTNFGFQTSQGEGFAPPVQVTQQHQANYPYDLHTAGTPVTSSSHVYNSNSNVYESQNMLPAQKELDDDEKNKRYQSTLQFAASLLLQIQQKRSGTETDGNH